MTSPNKAERSRPYIDGTLTRLPTDPVGNDMLLLEFSGAQTLLHTSGGIYIGNAGPNTMRVEWQNTPSTPAGQEAFETLLGDLFPDASLILADWDTAETDYNNAQPSFRIFGGSEADYTGLDGAQANYHPAWSEIEVFGTPGGVPEFFQPVDTSAEMTVVDREAVAEDFVGYYKPIEDSNPVVGDEYDDEATDFEAFTAQPALPRPNSFWTPGRDLYKNQGGVPQDGFLEAP